MKVAVVTPIYKQLLTAGERFSLQHGYGLLEAYDRIFVAPEGLDYRDTVQPDRVIYFDAKYFKSIAGYNRLMLAEDFYRKFSEYEYILIFQPDAFVFRDELHAWCAKDYAYIGAPWPGGSRLYPFGFYGVDYIGEYLPAAIRHRRIYVGNGGFSLRNVRAAIEMLHKHRWIVGTWSGNEDAFWSYYFASEGVHYSVPDEREASHFALELEAEKYYMQNGQLLPFGCHAWEKHSVEFWRKFIVQDGAELEAKKNQ